VTAPRPRIVPAPDRRRVSVLDLTVAQLEGIEREVGLPVNRWPSAPSVAVLYSAIIAAVEGVDRSELSGLTLRQLQERVDLSGDADPDR
jgi:hypothetical protein